MIYTFKGFTINSNNYQLLKNGEALSVEPQVFNIILYLVENQGRVVSRQELLDKIWKDKIVSDASISNHIKSARKALDDDGVKQAVIKTIHARGYQFIANCECVDESEKKKETNLRDTNNSKLKLLLLLTITMVVLIGIWFIKSSTMPLKSTVKNEKSIAVLAFKDFSPNSDQAYFAEGMSEELLNLFTQIPGLRVASRTSSFSFKTKDVTLEEIGRILAVNYIVEGSIRKAGNKLRVTAQLIRVKDGSHIWSHSYDYELKDIFIIQDEIAKAVSEQLKVSLSKGMTRTKLVSPKVESLHLKALYYYKENSRASLKEALELINEAIVLDSNYSPSWTLKSRIYYKLAVYSYDRDDSNSLDLAKTSIMKAMVLGGKSSTTHAQMALINLSDFDFDLARYNTELALSKSGGNPETTEISALYFQLVGQMEESSKLLENLRKFDPINDTHYLNLAVNQWFTNDLVQAYRTIKKYGYFRANAMTLYAIKSHILMELGDLDSAKIEIEKESNEFLRLDILGLLNFAQGNVDIADKLLIEIEQKYFFAPVHIALHYAVRKDVDNTLKWLNIALKNKDIELLYLINYPAFRHLSKHSRWVEFIDKIKLPKGHWLLKKSNSDD